MGILDRYIGRQVIISTLIAVIVLSGVLVLGRVMKQLEDLLGSAQLPPELVLEFVLNILPFSLKFTIPWGFLTAILLIFGRMSADNEIVSIRMAGVSMPRLCLPVFALAVGLAGICFWVNISVGPHAQAKIKRLFYEVATDDPATFFQAGKTIDSFPDTLIYTEGKNGNELTNLKIFTLDGRRVLQFLYAQRATLRHLSGEDVFELELEGAKVIAKNPDDPSDLSKVHPVSVEKRTLTFSLEKLKERAFRVNPGTKDTATLRAELASGVEEITQEELTVAQRSEWRTEISMRYSFSMACLTFALIGIPLGVTAQRRETSIGFVFSLIIGCVYFFFIILADSYRADPSKHAEVLMWIPNVIFIGLGFYLFRRLSRR